MLKRTLAIVLSEMLLSLTFASPQARSQTAEDALAVSKTRSEVLRLGVGNSARVEVKLRDNTKLKGYISEAGQESFTVTDSKSGASQTVAYSDVTSVKKPGGGISSKTWIIIGAAAAGAVITFVAVKPAICDGGAQSRFPC